MGLNSAQFQGRLPFDLKAFNQDDTEKQTMVIGSLAVKRNFKKQEDQYYADDMLDFKAFGAKADFILKYFPKGSEIVIQAEIRRNDNYEKDGQTVYGQMYVHVTDVFFAGKAEGGGNNAGASTSEPQVKVTTSGNPPKSTNPLKRRSII